MKLGYFPYVLYRDLDSTRRDDVEGLALVALPDDVRAVELDIIREDDVRAVELVPARLSMVAATAS